MRHVMRYISLALILLLACGMISCKAGAGSGSESAESNTQDSETKPQDRSETPASQTDPEVPETITPETEPAETSDRPAETTKEPGTMKEPETEKTPETTKQPETAKIPETTKKTDETTPVPPETTKTPETTSRESEETAIPEPYYDFDGSISETVLKSYLARAVTLSCEGGEELNLSRSYYKTFILNTGAKYIARSACCWSPSSDDLKTHDGQAAFIADIHKTDPDIIFEACFFECVGKTVNNIKIPAYVFEAFGLTPEDRSFSYQDMLFTDKTYVDQWGKDFSVPDITRLETQMFLYYRACTYINLGFEGLHMGQVELMGKNDRATGWESWTKVLDLVRAYAKTNARRHFVLINAHTHGITDANGLLMFDFHMWPSRPKNDLTQSAHAPSEDNPQKASLTRGWSNAIYGKSKGGKTHSGWSTSSLPYLVELDNYGDDLKQINTPANGQRVWGMDEITWFANQPASYRAQFLREACEFLKKTKLNGTGFLAMPGQRVARIYEYDDAGNVKYDEKGNAIIKSYRYYAFDPSYYKKGCGDEAIIRELWGTN